MTFETAPAEDPQVSNRVLTVANAITFARLLLIPASFALLLNGEDVIAAVLFAATALTDFLDGMVARATGTVTRLGQFLDPLVDRILVIAAVIGLLIVGRLPAWIVVLVFLRDIYLLAAGVHLLRTRHVRIPVSYVGKAGMWLLCIGFAGLILNIPQLPGPALLDLPWLPGLNAAAYCPFIWSVYAGLALSLAVTVIYTREGIRALALPEVPEEGGNGR